MLRANRCRGLESTSPDPKCNLLQSSGHQLHFFAEHAIFGMNQSGEQVGWSTAPTGDGVWFGVDGEGGSSSDYYCFEADDTGTVSTTTSDRSCLSLLKPLCVIAFGLTLTSSSSFGS